MWQYEFYLKGNDEPIKFFSDDPHPLDCVGDFLDEHRGEIEHAFCDCFPMTIQEYFRR